MRSPKGKVWLGCRGTVGGHAPSEVGVEEFVLVSRTGSGVYQTTTQVAIGQRTSEREAESKV